MFKKAQEVEINLENKVTFGHAITLLSVLVIPLIIWGVRVENRFTTVEQNRKELDEIKTDIKEVIHNQDSNYKKLYDLMVDIKLQLKDKADR